MADVVALHEAIRSGRAGEVAEMLARDPSLAARRGPDGLSPLVTACYHRRPDVIDALRAVRAPADVLEASAVGDAGRLAAMLEGDPDGVHARQADGFTPLHLAAFFGHARCVRALLGAGADVDAVADNPSRVRPLHSALAGRDATCVRALLDAGASVDARQQGGWTALMAAARHGDVVVLRALLDAGADPSLRADDGRTAADLAREAGQSEAQAFLDR